MVRSVGNVQCSRSRKCPIRCMEVINFAVQTSSIQRDDRPSFYTAECVSEGRCDCWSLATAGNNGILERAHAWAMKSNPRSRPPCLWLLSCKCQPCTTRNLLSEISKRPAISYEDGEVCAIRHIPVHAKVRHLPCGLQHALTDPPFLPYLTKQG